MDDESRPEAAPDVAGNDTTKITARGDAARRRAEALAAFKRAERNRIGKLPRRVSYRRSR